MHTSLVRYSSAQPNPTDCIFIFNTNIYTHLSCVIPFQPSPAHYHPPDCPTPDSPTTLRSDTRSLSKRAPWPGSAGDRSAPAPCDHPTTADTPYLYKCGAYYNSVFSFIRDTEYVRPFTRVFCLLYLRVLNPLHTHNVRSRKRR